MKDEIEITIPIPTDDEGYILLSCEHCGTLFKLKSEDIADDGVLNIFCPSCGLISEDYLTDDVIDLAMRKTKNTIDDMVYDMFRDLERNTKKGPVKIKAGKRPKHENEDPICSGIEAMESCMFPCCKRKAQIKPLLKMTGAYCPFCGVKNYEIE